MIEVNGEMGEMGTFLISRIYGCVPDHLSRNEECPHFSPFLNPPGSRPRCKT
jgi:hypothetical protein